MTTILTKELEDVWSTSPLAKEIRREESLFADIRRLKPKYGDLAWKNRDKSNPSPGFEVGSWSDKELADLESGLAEYGWGQWILIAGNSVKSRYGKNCNDKAREKRFQKYKRK